MGAATYGKEARRITARRGEPFILELEGHATAGYEWRVHVPDALKVKEVEVGAPSRGGLGAASSQRFEVEPLSPGRYRIRLEYGRSWEKEPQEVRTVDLEVTEPSS
jgi:predicted secreted protein